MVDLSAIPGYILIFAILVLSFFWLFIYRDSAKSKEQKRTLTKYPSVAVIIPTIHEGKFLGNCIQSALNLKYPKTKYKIYVALNRSSTEETVKTAAKFARKAKIINCPMNGKAKVMNYVLNNFAKEDLFLVLDADTVLESKMVMRLVPLFENKEVGAAVPSVQVLNAKTVASKLQKYEYILSVISRKSLSDMVALMIAHGAGTMFRTGLVKRLGGFDEKNNPTEDLEMGLRILTSGYRIETDPKALSYTMVPETFGKLFEQRKRWSSGFFFNIIKYRKRIFERSNSRLGLFVVPLLLFSTMLGIVSLILLLNAVLNPVGNFFLQQYLLIKNTSLDFAFSSLFAGLAYSINGGTIFTILTTVISVFTLYYALKYSEIKFDKVKDAIGIVGYIFFYIFFLSFVWLYTAIAFLVYRQGFSWKSTI